jgi:UDP-N-acetylmuramate dehydrogenase
MEHHLAELASLDVGQLLPNEPMAPHTTWHIGGPADLMVIPGTKDQLVRLVGALHERQVPWMVIGRGSNLLVTDKGIRGVVIKLGSGFDDVRFEGKTVHVGGAFSMIKLSVLAGKQGLTGLEFAGGIPGSVGGAVFMNAGALGGEMARVLKVAEVLLETGELTWMTADELAFSYRHSRLQEMKGIVTEAVLGLEYGDRKEIAAAMATYKDRRLRTQPLKENSAGSVFRNPAGHHAARLIEEAGLKGFRVGGACVSPLHANFIVNAGDATASDVLTLIEHIQAVVEKRFGVRLIPEVRVVGER